MSSEPGRETRGTVFDQYALGGYRVQVLNLPRVCLFPIGVLFFVKL